MNEVFRYVTPITYGLIVVIWFYIFVFYLKKVNYNQKQDKLRNLLLFILIVDAFRTIFEGAYFGLRFAFQEGFVPFAMFDVLQEPQYVFLPKIITLVTGVLVLVLVLYKWLPAEIKQNQAIKDLIYKKNAELLQKNQELIYAKEKAEESARLKTEFLNNISHEIRTPMNGIIGFSEMLDSPDISNEKRSFYAKIVQNSSEQLLRIIDDILEISNLEAKQETVKETRFCLNELLDELFSIFQLKAQETEIGFVLKKELSYSESQIITDKTKINKILSSLLENAFRFTRTGSVEIGYNIIANNLVFYIKDTGIGISPENLENVFERFSQEEKEISRKYGGLGLGLSISKENAKLLGGDITVHSEKGMGTTFYVTIPYISSPKVDGNTSEPFVNSPIPSGKDNYTVLIAEDEEVNYQYLKKLLQKRADVNYTIIHAKNGKEAVEICTDRTNIDIVLMDIKMPVMNGYEATEKIKSLFPQIPIIAQTAYSTESDRLLALQFGCDDFISKPIDKEKLFALMHKHMHKK